MAGRVRGTDPQFKQRAAPHEDVVRLVAQFAAANVPTYDTLSVSDARAVLEKVTRLQLPSRSLAYVRDVLVPGAAGLLPARVYHPSPGSPLPLVVYLHGGGWVLGSISAADGPCRQLARSSHSVVVSIEYRRAPETKFPGPLDDCVAAVRHLARHALEFGGDGRVVLLGDSAGGNLVAAAALLLRDQGGPRLDAQVLLYPALAPPSVTAFSSYDDYGDGPLMTRREMVWFWEHYLRGPDDRKDARAAPLLADDLSRLPPTTIVVAEVDPLRDEGLAYGDRLRSDGVDVQTITYRGAAHGFWWMDRVMRQAAELNRQLGRILRESRGAPDLS